MFYNKKLYKEVFERHKSINVDELVVITGSIGGGPFREVKNLPIKSNRLCNES